MSKFRKGASPEEIRDTQKGSSATKHGFLFDRDDEVNSYVAQIMNGQTTLEDVPEELQTNVKSELRANGFKQTSKNEGAKMSITRSMIRNIVNETLSNLFEEEDDTESSAEIVARKAAEVAKEEEKAANIKAAEAKVKASTAQATSDMLKANSMKSEHLSIRKNILIEMRKQGII